MLGSVTAHNVLAASTTATSATPAGEGVAIAVAIVSTVVVLGLCAALAYLLAAVRQLRREASALAAESSRLIDEMSEAVAQAKADLKRVDRMVGSAEAISDAVGSASRLVGGVVADPLIKLVAFGSGIAEGARHLTGAVPTPSRRTRNPGPLSPRSRDAQGAKSRSRLPASNGRKAR